MSRPGRTALWQNLLRDNQKPASALDAVISVILPNGTNGTHLSATHPSRSSRCPELASSYYLCHYRPTSACFCHRLYTSARRLPVACPSLARRLPAACSACSARSSQPACRSRCSSLPAAPACPLLQPARCSSLPAVLPAVLPALPALPALPLCRSACSSPPACKKSETLKSLAFLLSGLGLRQPPPDFLRVSPENLPGRAARGSWPNRPRDVSLRR